MKESIKELVDQMMNGRNEKTEKEMAKFRKSMNENLDNKQTMCVLYVTNTGMGVYGDKGEVLAMYGVMYNHLLECGLSKDEMEMAVRKTKNVKDNETNKEKDLSASANELKEALEELLKALED